MLRSSEPQPETLPNLRYLLGLGRLAAAIREQRPSTQRCWCNVWIYEVSRAMCAASVFFSKMSLSGTPMSFFRK